MVKDLKKSMSGGIAEINIVCKKTCEQHRRNPLPFAIIKGEHATIGIKIKQKE